MKKLFLFLGLGSWFLSIGLLLEGLGSLTLAQSHKLDSIKQVIHTTKEDTTRINALNALGWELMYSNPDTSIILSNQALMLAEKLEWKQGIANSYGNLGSYYYLKADYPRSLGYYLKALKIDEQLNNKKGIATLLGNIGNVYRDQADFPKALDYYLKALKMDEELGNKNGIVRHLGNIGTVYLSQVDYPKVHLVDRDSLLNRALDYYLRALKIGEKLGNKNFIAGFFSNIGVVYYEQAKQITTRGERRETRDEGKIHSSPGTRPSSLFNKALDYYFKALKMYEELGNKSYQAITLGNIGSLYTSIGKYNDAYNYLYRALAIDDSIGTKDGAKYRYEALSVLYEKSTAALPDSTGGKILNKEEMRLRALHYFKSYLTLRDTLFSEENKKQIVRKEMNFEFEKKEAAAKAEQEKKDVVAAAESKRQRLFLWLVAAVAAAVSVIALISYRSYLHKRKANVLLTEKNTLIEKQQTNIIDSIDYAKLIQDSILVPEDEIRKNLPDSFVYFQPKDIVSGDFYWFSRQNGKSVIAAVDCTGHGVPGAFMSMIGNTLLNEIVNEKHITEPAAILKQLHLEVIAAFHHGKENAQSHDYMEMSLCVINHKKKLLKFAGAMNPLYVVQNGKLEVINGDIRFIGGPSVKSTIDCQGDGEFTDHELHISKNLTVYMFSDGYVDQFGGENKKRFGSTRFRQLLADSQRQSMQEQKDFLARSMEEWMTHPSQIDGKYKQIDDMLVVGVRFT